MRRKQFQGYGRGPRCHCKKFGHIKRNCDELAKSRIPVSFQEKRREKRSAYKVTEDKSDSESIGLVVCHTLIVGTTSSQGRWIVDSGATCHMCNNQKMFMEFQALDHPSDVTLGDGHTLKASGRGKVALEMKLPTGRAHCTMSSWCPTLHTIYSVCLEQQKVGT